MLKINLVSDSTYTVQGHGVHTAFVELADALGRLYDVSVTINSRLAADVSHIHTVGFLGLWHLLRGSGKKVVSAHVVPKSFVGSLAGARFWSRYAALYLRWFYNRADLVLAPTKNTEQELKDLGVARPVIVFPNIINTGRYKKKTGRRLALRKRHGIGEKQFVVVGSGQIQPRKRVDVFIKLARLNPDIMFLWVGDIPFGRVADSVKAMTDMIKNAPPNFRSTGLLPLERVADYYQLADVFLLPSEQETFGLAVVEAASAGLPVILRDIPDYNQTFRDDATVADDKTFNQAIRRLRDDRQYRLRMRKKSLKLASRYDSRDGVKRLVALYRALAASRLDRYEKVPETI